MKLTEIKDLLRECGVVGAGGAGFPSYAKLNETADTILLNCAECEPLLKVHRQVLEHYTTEVLEALSEMLRATGAKQAIIAIKEHYHSTLKALEAELPDYEGISVCKLASVYPAGDEIILIKEVTGRLVEPGQLPISVGVTVCNVESVYNVWRALHGGVVTDKFVTVAGEVKQPKTLYVPLGTTVAELIAAAGGVTDESAELVSGGPMMGRLVSPHDVVTKTTNAILVLPKNNPVIMNKHLNPKVNLKRTMSVCCQCESCTELCSRHVIGYPVTPHLVMRDLSNGGKGDLKVLDGSLFCSGCGLCETYSCPQGLSPRAMIAELKNAARAKNYKPTEVPVDRNVANADLKKISVSRLTARLGLTKYDVPAPMTEDFTTKKVKLMLSQHLGAPSVPVVKVGEQVTKGQLIAIAKEGALSVNLHASIDGVVDALTDRYIRIKT
ncbi:MAG: SLBB domain-containing protein [Clostridia bacterium]|nr:SLBB domain-containing protein [Clostridia bacterium]